MTSGQVVLDLAFEGAHEDTGAAVLAPVTLLRRPRVLRADAAELAAHEQRLDALDKAAQGGSVWRRLEQPEAVAAEA
jgi:DNA polymerase-3 subunit epsilon